MICDTCGEVIREEEYDRQRYGAWKYEHDEICGCGRKSVIGQQREEKEEIDE